MMNVTVQCPLCEGCSGVNIHPVPPITDRNSITAAMHSQRVRLGCGHDVTVFLMVNVWAIGDRLPPPTPNPET